MSEQFPNGTSAQYRAYLVFTAVQRKAEVAYKVQRKSTKQNKSINFNLFSYTTKQHSTTERQIK